jgi:hypothetical protein
VSADPSAPVETGARSAPSGLVLSRRLFEVRGRAVLERLDLLDRCAVGCIGSTSQNAGLDDAASRDHAWGPYLTFFLFEEDWAASHERLQEAVQEMPDEVDGVRWVGYGGPTPRRTGVCSVLPFLRSITGFQRRPQTSQEWLPYLTRASFLGRRWTERLFDAGQGEVFHDPGGRFTALWREWTAYVPPDVHRALLARGLFRLWNAGPEYNLARSHGRGDPLAFSLCLARFVNEVLELAFTWNGRYVPAFKWRAAHFRRLPLLPPVVRHGVEALCAARDVQAQLTTAHEIIRAVKALLLDRYQPQVAPEAQLSAFAHAIRASIEDEAVRQHASLDW